MNNELFDNDVSKLHDTSSDGKSRLNPKYRFSSFIIDENNKIAYKAAMGVAKARAIIRRTIMELKHNG